LPTTSYALLRAVLASVARRPLEESDHVDATLVGASSRTALFKEAG